MRNNIKTIFTIMVIFAAAMALCSCGNQVKISDDMTPSQTVEAFLESFKAQEWDNMDEIYAGKSEDFKKAYGAEIEDSEGSDASGSADASGDADGSGGSAGSDSSAGSGNSSGDDMKDLASALRKTMNAKLFDFDYTVDGEEISEDGNTAEVDITITTYDMVKVFNDFYKEYMDKALEKYAGNSGNMNEEDLQKMAIDILQEKLDNTTEKDYEDTAVLKLTKTDGRWVVDEINEETNAQFLNAISGGMMNVANDIVNARTGGSDSEGNSDSGDSDSDSGSSDSTE